MNTKVSFLFRLILISVFALALMAVAPVRASFIQSPDGPASPPGWAAIRPPHHFLLAIDVTPPGDPTTTEGGTTATISMVLDSEPTDDVTIPVSSTDISEGTVNVTQLVFTPANYTTPQDITVTGQNDAIADGNINYTIQLGPATSTDLTYDGENPDDVNLTNTDNDTAGFTISAISGATSETGTTATFTVALTSEPIADVTIGVTSGDTTEGTVDKSSLTFTNLNWATTQTVTVTGVNDAIADGNVVYSIVLANPTGGDATYDALNPADVSVTNNDDTDTAGFTISAISGATSETGTTATFTVALTSEPIADVTIGVTSGDTTEGTVDKASLTFTNLNWGTTQTVTVTGVNDAIDDGNVVYSIVLASPTGSDTTYNAINPADVSVTNNDDADTAGITVDPTSGLVTDETGLADSFTVVLTSEPIADVTIGITGDANEGTLDKSSLTFTNLDWGTTQTVTVTGVDDLIDDGNVTYNVVLASPTGSDTTYNAINPADVSVTNNDDGDTAGITVTPTTGMVTTEATDDVEPTFTVVLNTKPKGNVTIGLSSSQSLEGTVSPTSLTFKNSDWNIPQTVTVTGVDDSIDDGDVAYTIITAPAESTGNSDYDGLDADDVSVTNIDNDTAGFVITPTSGLITTEASGSATFTVALKSEPIADVILNLGSNDVTEGTSSPTTLTFTAINWADPQVVEVVGVDDQKVDGDIAYKIVTDPALSDDPNYSGRNPSNVSVTNQDDDVAGILVDPINGLITSESGGTATFTIVLDTQPTAKVSLNLQSSDTTEGSVSPESLTFTVANWDTPQTVTVTGKNDNLADGSIIYTIMTSSATSTDPNYSGVDAHDVEVTNADDDTPGITIAPLSNLITTEGGLEGKISILLNTEPTSSVTFTLSSDDLSEGVFFLDNPDQPITVTFTSTDWNVVQEIQIFGVDDLAVDGDVPYTIQVVSSSGDPDYNSKSQELSAINLNAPTIEWVLPELNPDGYYETSSPELILLGVEATNKNKEPISKVRFYRWDPEVGQNVTLFEDPDSPYQFYLDPKDLDYGWNQIRAFAIDNDGDNTQSKHELLLISRLARLYLPSVHK